MVRLAIFVAIKVKYGQYRPVTLRIQEVSTHAFTAESAVRRAFQGVSETGCFCHSVQGCIHSGPGKARLMAPPVGWAVTPPE